MPIRIFSTCPPYRGAPGQLYLEHVRQVARWSEDAGCEGMLVYTDNSLPDPWLISQVVIESTQRLSPLVAVQPIYMHPYSVAKMVSGLGLLYGRRICLNMVAGGFTNDLVALGDTTPHDRRYDRLVEYTQIILKLLAGEHPVTLLGDFYQVENCKLTPSLPHHLFPLVTLAGSSPAGLAAAKAVNAIAVKYPEPPEHYAAQPRNAGDATGIRIGIIARDSAAEAWRVAHERFPTDRAGQIAHQLAMKVSDSVWHRQLSELASAETPSPYWLVPFENYKTFCPYLVGSYEQVAAMVDGYLSTGHETFILDVPGSPDDLSHIGRVFAGVQKAVA